MEKKEDGEGKRKREKGSEVWDTGEKKKKMKGSGRGEGDGEMGADIVGAQGKKGS